MKSKMLNVETMMIDTYNNLMLCSIGCGVTGSDAVNMYGEKRDLTIGSAIDNLLSNDYGDDDFVSGYFHAPGSGKRLTRLSRTAAGAGKGVTF